MKTECGFFLFLLGCVVAMAAVNPAEQEMMAKHKPHIRYISGIKYDITPLIRWHSLDQEIMRRTLKPRELERWVYIRTAGASTRTNGWCIIDQGSWVGRKQPRWIAIKNMPDPIPLHSFVYSFGTSHSLPVGNTHVSAAAYDFGTTNLPARK